MGPIQHDSLHPALLARIEKIARILEEVDGQPAAEWMKDFQRDQNPEKEVIIWETVAATYQVFTRKRSLTLEAKKEAFHLLLMRSMHDEKTVMNEAKLKNLDRADAVVLLAAFQGVASAKGWGFPFPSLGAPDFCSPTTNHASDSPVPQNDGEFTIRDEANALTALAFRNGFIEELHAGKRSSLLDQPDYSRITDDEMRRLMIEASEKLAQMLSLKQTNPDQYEAQIRDYHERYCRTWKRE